MLVDKSANKFQMSEYTKPKNKTTLTVRFRFIPSTGQSQDQLMELTTPPKLGEHFANANMSICKITKVAWVPWNENYPDVHVEGVIDPGMGKI